MRLDNTTGSAVEAAQNSKVEPREEVVPFKLVGQVIAAKTRDGQVVREFPVADLAIWAPDFGRLAEQIEELWPQILERLSDG